MMRKFTLCALVLSSAILVPQAAAQQFRGRDLNGDGVITRSEWRGNYRSFMNFDRDGNGYISDDEMPISMRRDNRNQRSRDYGTRNRTIDNATDKLDRNRSGVVEGYEWPYNSSVFHKLDRDGNSVLSQNELANLTSVAMIDLDRNNNRRIDANEWPGGFAEFDRLDDNRDGVIASGEYFERGGEWQRRQRFREWDTNRDGIISSTEWRSRPDLFHQLDTTRDSQLNWDEFMASTEQYDRPFGWRNR